MLTTDVSTGLWLCPRLADSLWLCPVRNSTGHMLGIRLMLSQELCFHLPLLSRLPVWLSPVSPSGEGVFVQHLQTLEK